MSKNISSIEIAKSTRTLICLLQSLINEKILIELRNDYFVLGILQSCDCYMNCELSSTLIWSLNEWILLEIDENNINDNDIITINMNDITDLQTKIDKMENLKNHHNQRQMDYLFLKGNRIRYVHLMNNENLIELIEKQLNNYRQRSVNIKKQINQRPFNWKSYRKKLKQETNENVNKS